MSKELTVKDVSKRVGRSEQVVSRHIRNGRLKAEKRSNQYFVKEEDLQPYIEWVELINLAHNLDK